jgi:putative ABC transport system permease protein
VIDEVFARKYLGNTNAIGKLIHLDGSDKPSQIVGVVGHVEQWSLDSGGKDELLAQLYEPFRQLGDNSLTTSQNENSG